MAEYEPIPQTQLAPRPSKSDSSALALVERVAEVDAMIARGFTDGQIRDVLRREHGCSMGRGNQAIRLARLVQQRNGGVAREVLRAQGNAMILASLKRAVERKRAMGLGIGPGLQRLVYVDDPDGATEAKMIDAFCRYHGLYQQPDSGGGVNLTILQVLQQHMRGSEGATLPETTIDAEGEPGR